MHHVDIVAVGNNVDALQKFRDKTFMSSVVKQRQPAPIAVLCSPILFTHSQCMWLSPLREWTQSFDHSVPNLTFHQYLWSAAARDFTLFLFYLRSKRKSIRIKMFGGQQILVLSKFVALSTIEYFQFISVVFFHRLNRSKYEKRFRPQGTTGEHQCRKGESTNWANDGMHEWT